MSHHLTQCPFTADMGLEIKYSGTTDKRRSDYDKKKIKAAKSKAKDKDDDSYSLIMVL